MANHRAVQRSERTRVRRPTDACTYLVGLDGAKQHPGGARYVGFRPFLPAGFVPAPVKLRHFTGYWGRRLNAAIAVRTSHLHPDYTLGLLLMEATAALHMLPRRGAIYHATRGDTDITPLLPRAARMTGNYVLATFHDPPSILSKWQIHERITNQLHGVILLSEYQRSYFAGHLPEERIFVVHHSVDTEFFRPPVVASDDPVCITVGAYMRDPDTVATAMQLVWRVNPRVRLVAVGTARPGYVQSPPPLEDERVVLLDSISDLQLLRAYQSASIAILSVWDAVANNAILESLACGLPLVASDVGAVGEYIGEEAGLLFPSGDAEALAHGILRLVEDGTTRRRKAAAARTRALEFDHRVAAGHLREVYKQIRARGQG